MPATIKLYTAGTPNGQKVNIALEELGLDYEVIKIDIAKNVQKEPWFLDINPNGRIPAIVDTTVNPPQRIFEGGSILQYLTARYDKDHKISFPYDSAEYWETIEWIVWMQSGIGPMQGQANHFYRYAPEKIEYGINRYQTETKRLYQVLEDRLVAQSSKGKGLWIVGGKYTIADLACFSWVEWFRWAGLTLDKFPKIQEWKKVIEERPATEKGLNVPDKFELREAMKTKEGEEEYAKHHSNWVMQGQKADQEKHK
ncbi:glutathione S-transferase [Myriangium duriaei CBS 260.36]|uniref:Glutathione S-transferase n=1 Tax=Myriangium duriaei CBS 260.36 TaxID=1168546 RepID=A0A9P4IUR6_9PEZI|nr:glutathione S-transferase [Myriangium duriaei CBS 260.36]